MKMEPGTRTRCGERLCAVLRDVSELRKKASAGSVRNLRRDRTAPRTAAAPAAENCYQCRHILYHRHTVYLGKIFPNYEFIVIECPFVM